MATHKNEHKSILEMLYEAHRMEHQVEIEDIKAAYDALYASMDGMSIQATDPIVYAACNLAQAHEQQGFVDGVCVGLRLAHEVEG